ncbi:MAG: hypothetical protein RIC16_16870 [Rhodospirillales bacterium]
MIIVLLNNKLLSCDTITPFLFEVAEKNPGRAIELYCFNAQTYDAICRNIVLWDALREFASLRIFGSSSKTLLGRLVGRPKALFRLARFCLLALSGKADFIHFKALNVWPLRLVHILNRGRTYFVQQSVAGSTTLERQVDNIAKPRSYSDKEPAVTDFVAFRPNWDHLAYYRESEHGRHIISPPCNRPAWIAYLKQQSGKYLSEIGIAPDTRIITYILSSMDTNGFLRNADDFPILFEETLQTLAKSADGVPIVVKPHPATLPKYFDIQREIIARNPQADVRYADINPMLLTFQSCFFVSNGYSSTFAMAKERGITTIEYTDPSEEILEATGGGSMRPDMVDHFIRRDADELAATVSELLGRNSIGGKEPPREAVLSQAYESLLNQVTAQY